MMDQTPIYPSIPLTKGMNLPFTERITTGEQEQFQP